MFLAVLVKLQQENICKLQIIGLETKGCMYAVVGILFEVKRVELHDPSALFCIWVMRDHFHSQKQAAAKTQLLLSSLASSSQTLGDVSALSLAEVSLLDLL